MIPAGDAVHRAFPARSVDASQVVDLRHGRTIEAAGIDGTYAAFGPDGALIALVVEQDAVARSVLGWQVG